MSQTTGKRLHQFRSDLNGVLNAIELINEYFDSDRRYCAAALREASKNLESIRANWSLIEEDLINQRKGK